MFECDKKEICPYLKQSEHKCGYVISGIKDELRAIVDHLGLDIKQLSQNEIEIGNLGKQEINNEIKIILKKIGEIIKNQISISESTSSVLLKTIEGLKDEIESLKRDRLTGLLNRHTIDEDFEKLAIGKYFSIAIIDVDDFKFVNDTYGHVAGDAVLRILAKLLKENFGDDYTYRLGGEEFMIMTSLSIHRLKAFLDEILSYLNKKNIKIKNDKKFKITFSAGVVPYSGEENFHDLYEKADKILYKVKHSGKNRVDIG